MSEQPPPDRASPGSSGQQADWDAAPGRELDQALSQAADLAADLAGQVGPADPQPDVGESRPPRDPLDASRTDLESELHELQRLVDATTSAVDSQGTPAADAEPTRRTIGEAIPDFMAEFTRSEEPNVSTQVPARASASLSPAPAKPATTASTDVAELTAVGIVGGPVILPTDLIPPSPAADEPEEGDKASAPTETAAEVNGQRMPERVSEAVAGLCERATALLELLDRPFARIGPETRAVCGWIALGTLVAAVILWTLSLP